MEKYYTDKNKYLCYCTKYFDKKDHTDHNFKQFRWQDIAKRLKQFPDNPLVNSYLKFLNLYKMEQTHTFKSENLVAMENMQQTFNIINYHLENVKPKFIKIFGKSKNVIIITQLQDHNRFCNYTDKILGNSGYSEILYSFNLNTLKLSSQIWVNRNNSHYIQFKELIRDNEFKCYEEDNYGCGIYLDKSLGNFLNDENSDESIKKWFIESFEKFKEFIIKNEHLEWNVKFEEESQVYK